MDFSQTVSRRTVLRTAAAGTALATLPLSAEVAQASGRRDHSPAPDTVPLPAGLRPEGITSGPGTTYYVGSLRDGRIVTGDLYGGGSRVLHPGAAGRSIRGLKFDRRTRLVWAVGNAGDVSRIWAIDTRNGELVSSTAVPGGVFLNDLVITRRSVWVTDSRMNRLTRIRLTRSGQPTGAAPTFLPLSGEWPAGDGQATNANGIRALPDGSLILNNSRVGGLWQVSTADGHTREIEVKGGPGIIGGDGLEIAGDTLFNVRGSGPNQVAVLTLKSRHRRHDREDRRHRHDDSNGLRTWTARWVGALTDETLDVPSTATVAAGALWAVNARFGVAAPETAKYWITRLSLRRR
ncbi:MAG: hypothetical protein QOF52_276 [Propionibacteriaceae bacterium]|jgi:sugar lactone lactonase YvrE|nr:hypothetical protein [Propionibacteriaceae bacterium]MDX6320418.1 hypothetical protein [Propionibacteriaceae bacterium]